MLKTKCRGEICFTGFNKIEKAKLTLEANEHSFIVRSNVTKKLTYLCCGKNAGPKKMERAAQQGTTIIGKDEFEKMVSI